MVGPFRPTPEYEPGYSCFQQVNNTKSLNKISFTNQYFHFILSRLRPRLFCLKLIFVNVFSHLDKLPSFKHLQTTMSHHQQCPQETQMEVWFPQFPRWSNPMFVLVYFYNWDFMFFLGANLKLSEERRMPEEITDEKPINLRLDLNL